ncbi:hypothetical protein TNCV_3144071 [Trichonephila clavipes]|nr:hypothetical protein TNCV_3144071 [Trichonephila clavipes]
MQYHGVGRHHDQRPHALHVVANGTMTGQRYIDEVLLPHVRLFRGAVGLSRQRGYSPSRMASAFSDLNPIETVWDALGRQVAGRNYPPTNKNTLIRALTEEWDKLPQQLLDNVVQSMVQAGLRRRLMMMPDHHPDEPFYVRAVTELQDIEEAMILAIVLENTVNDELNLSQNKFELPQGAHFNNLEDSGPVENENNPNGSKNSASQNAPQTQLPPPIMLFVEKNYKAQMAAITKAFPKIRSRLTGEFLKLYTDSAEERRMAVQHLTMLDFQFYTIKSKAERPIKVVIKGLPRNTNPEEIKQDLEILGYTPDRVNQLIGRKK